MKRSNFYLIILCSLVFLPIMLSAHGVSTSDQDMLRNGGLIYYILVGAKHMMTGYDHLLFLTGVLFYLKGFKDIIRFITAFTIGHSIILILATYLGIKIDEHLIDAIIALSVLYKGFENLNGFERFFNTSSPNLLTMVFIFGLIHGFGLSTRLQSFDIGDSQFLAKIVCFNVGVELGQVVALIPIVYIITRWQKLKSYDAFYKAVNTYLIIAGIGLFVYQMYGYLSLTYLI
ncbi:MAG TPA: HupE/UreJ family protein [Saprospiraceae bacterium]|nr:HupE/UreJ family protein [Saprospiraceae bacterium]